MVKCLDFECTSCFWVFEDLVSPNEVIYCPVCKHQAKAMITFASHVGRQDLQTTAASDHFLSKTKRWRNEQ